MKQRKEAAKQHTPQRRLYGIVQRTANVPDSASNPKTSTNRFVTGELVIQHFLSFRLRLYPRLVLETLESAGSPNP
jgi:hypothetical protein